MSNFRYVVKASTPAEFQADIVKWLETQALDHRARARALTRTKKAVKENQDKAEVYEFCANFIKTIFIEPTLSTVPPWEQLALQRAEICKNECLTLLIDGNKWLDAVRLYRQKTGSPLKDAKAVIEGWQAMLDMAEAEIKEHCKAVAKHQKIMAIRDYRFWGKYKGREITLKDALDFVNSLV